MNKCIKCGCVFDDDEIAVWNENHGERGGVPMLEKMGGCPLCEAEFVEVKKCELCDEYVIEKDSGETYCDECKRITLERFARMMLENFGEEEIELIAEEWEGTINGR